MVKKTNAAAKPVSSPNVAAISTISSKEQLASMLSYARSITPSRGLLYACVDIEGNAAEPLKVESRGLRGTKSFDIWGKVERARKDSDEGDKNTKLDDATQPNPQWSDSAYLPEDKPFLMNRFQVKYLCKTDRPHMCSDLRIMKAFMDLVDGFKKAGGFSLLAELYVAPLVTGLWMFRNNDEAVSKRISIVNTATQKTYVFTPGYNQFSLEDLSREQQAMAAELANLIEQALTHKESLLRLNVEAVYEMGSGMPAYPSQEMDTMEKKEGDLTRKLYRVRANGTDNQAGFHDVKLGNALRTIDIWHGNELFDATPIEPLGVVSTHMVSLRLEDRRDFFSLVKANLFDWEQQLNAGAPLNKISNLDDLCFVIAVLIRGGAYV